MVNWDDEDAVNAAHQRILLNEDLLKSAKTGDLEGWSKALEAGADPNYQGDSPRSAMEWAARGRHSDMLAQLPSDMRPELPPAKAREEVPSLADQVKTVMEGEVGLLRALAKGIDMSGASAPEVKPGKSAVADVLANRGHSSGKGGGGPAMG